MPHYTESESAVSPPNETPKKVEIKAVELTIEEKVSIAFNGDPKMLNTIKHESNFTQFYKGKPNISKTSDVGVMQINQVHWEEAKSLGLDIFNSVDDNIAMGKIIFDQEGYNAWVAYRQIYGTRSKPINAANAAAGSTINGANAGSTRIDTGNSTSSRGNAAITTRVTGIIGQGRGDSGTITGTIGGNGSISSSNGSITIGSNLAPSTAIGI